MDIISIQFTDDDVKTIAEQENIPPAIALERALEWGAYIASTATQLCSEQLTSCIIGNQP